MKVIYICECCERAIDQIDFDEVEVERILDDTLTAGAAQDIIKMQLGASRRYVSTICDDCLADVDWEDTMGDNPQQLIN